MKRFKINNMIHFQITLLYVNLSIDYKNLSDELAWLSGWTYLKE